jgi:hypothetical protein
MLVRNCTYGDLHKALDTVNERYSGNVQFAGSLDQAGNAIRFTLKVVDSKAPGHRLGFRDANGKQRRMASACFHVHGYFFVALFDLAPSASIRAGDVTVTKGHEWDSDRNIGSIMEPMYYSEACECDA